MTELQLADVPGRLALLQQDARPRWGRMSPQQMVEHLDWTFRVSLGEVSTTLATPDEKLPGVRAFLRSGKPMPQNVALPGLEELPALVHPDLDAARTALSASIERFLADTSSPATPVHPVFGPLDHGDWLRFHRTHLRHHLDQFGL